MSKKSLKSLLDTLYLQYRKKFSSIDPIWNLHRFSDPKDIEIVGLVTSAYSYGQVNLINKFIDTILKRISNKPHEFTINFEKRKDKKYLKGLGYRFHKEHDLMNLFHSINKVLISHGSLHSMFLSGFDDSDLNIIPALTSFSSKIVRNIKFPVSTEKFYFNYLIPNPSNGSTCKRLNLFLRWMVRKDEIDLGVWNDIPSSKLIIPVDIHISRVAKKLKLVNRKSIDLKFAIELTDKLREFDADDPVKYDFSLCHYQMEGKKFSI